MLLRDLTLGPVAPLLDRLVLRRGGRPTMPAPASVPTGSDSEAGWREPAGGPLELASEDGVATWNLLDAGLAVGRPYPILRSRRAVSAAAEVAP